MCMRMKSLGYLSDKEDCTRLEFFSICDNDGCDPDDPPNGSIAIITKVPDDDEDFENGIDGYWFEVFPEQKQQLIDFLKNIIDVLEK